MSWFTCNQRHYLQLSLHIVTIGNKKQKTANVSKGYEDFSSTKLSTAKARALKLTKPFFSTEHDYEYDWGKKQLTEQI